ncbi:equilibrative nucleoside transporter 3-like [Oppia nitens]|uniref:equilibrative nucleoside transporter 3-like n=1 Tax=Oppia nitens TaxID=1686743 RepID=UPI0023DAC0AA|nr:equilibrative nucleoside transporter 3-like [Oppia nitens]
MEPTDKKYIVYIVMFFHGIAALFAWNMLINSDSYFVDYKLNVSNNSSETLKTYRKNFLSYLGIASKAPNILFQFINMFLSSNYKSLSKRIWSTLLFQALVFIVITGLAFADSSQWPEIFFWITMLLAFIVNIANGIFQCCVYGIAAKLPVQYTNAVTMGFNLSGVIAAIFLIISLSIAPTPKVSAVYFFSVAVIYLLLCFMNELFIRKNKFYTFYMTKNAQIGDQNIDIVMKTIASRDSNQNDSKQMDIIISDKHQQTLSGYQLYLHVFYQIWPQLLTIIVIYFVTFSIFPSLQANIRPLNQLISDKYFVPVFCFLIFPLFKTIGNSLAEWLPKPSPKFLIVYSLLRLIFIPFFLFCNFFPNDRHLPVLIGNDILYILGAILMSLTSGYLSSLAIMYCPMLVEPRYASIAGMMASFTILFGILLGLNFSLVYPIIINL